MNAVLNLLANEEWTHFTFTLLHTLWQGPLVAVTLYFVLRMMPVERPNRRYAVSLAALGLVVLAAMVTWSLYRLDTPRPVPVEASHSVSMPAPAIAAPAVSAALPAPVPSRARDATWTAWLAAAWLAGTGLGLLRVGRLLWRAGRLRRQAKPWDEAGVQEVLAKLGTALGVARRVRVAVSERIDVPGVIGLLRPVVVFPASIVAGMPPAHLDAILAHELAHIRRYDYWVNLFQLLVEALLFFNPAVWWIGRRIRIEREACCDALAASVTELPATYASALADLAERLNPGGVQPALAATGGEDRHVLLDRVKRLVVPGYRPRLVLPWYTLMALLIGGMVILAGLSQGVFSAVAFAAQVLTPTERIAQIQAIQEEHAAPKRDESGEPVDKLPISGTVRSEDGLPLPEGVELLFISSGGGSPCGGMSVDRTVQPDGRFEDRVAPGSIHIAATAEGYAFSLLGPLEGKAGETLEGLELVLRRGAPAQIRVTGPEGTPVAGAKLSVGYRVKPYSSVERLQLETNQDGLATIDHYAGAPISFTVVAEGFAKEQSLNGETLDPQRPFECRLNPARPTTGVARAEESGQPLAGLSLRQYAELCSNVEYYFGEAGETVAESDAQGRFTLGNLREDTTYYFVACGADGRKKLLQAVSAGQTLDFTVPPPIRIRGRVVGDLSLLKKDDEGLYIQCGNEMLEGFRYADIPTVRVEVRGNEGIFETAPLWPGAAQIVAGPKRTQLALSKPIDDLVIDLSPEKLPSKKTRTLVLRFKAGIGAPAPEGTVGIKVSHPELEEIDKDGIPVVHGEARVEIPAPSTLAYRLEGLAGYWAEDQDGIEVPEGAEPFPLTVRVKPAGAIHGRILNPDGSGANAYISLQRVKEPWGLKGKRGFYGSSAINGNFLIAPIPCGLTCAIVASYGNRIALSEKMKVSESNPIHEVTLQFAEGQAIHGRMIDENGKPVTGVEVGIQYISPYGRSIETLSAKPDFAGLFTIEDVNPNIPGGYALVSSSTHNYVPFEVPAEPGEKEYTITVKRGLSMHGRILNSKTGAPVQSATITAIRNESEESFDSHFAEGPTDENGAFRFSNLSPGTYYFYVNGWSAVADPPAVAGADTEVLLKVEQR